MFILRFFLITVHVSAVTMANQWTTTMTEVVDIGTKRFSGHFKFNLVEDLNGWELDIHFSDGVLEISSWMADLVIERHGALPMFYRLINKNYNGILRAGATLDIPIQGTAIMNIPTANGTLKNMRIDGFTVKPVANNDGTKYNYNEVLQKSILFYAAQRSGSLPDNRIPWRGSSALRDHGDSSEDLTGGWYDGSNNVKFGFPMAASTTLLGWSLFQYKDAYQASGQLEAMYDCIRWPLEWLVKCHTGQNELYVQVGVSIEDYISWVRPEDMPVDRPAFKITASKPGSDIAAEYAAAMAVGSIVFKRKDPAFSTKLLTHAKELYRFAKSHRGIYSDSVPQANAYYSSSNYEDELCWGAAWLYLATSDSQYLNDAENFYISGEAWGQSWNDKNTGNMILLYKITHKDKYKNDTEATFADWLPGSTAQKRVPYTPKGLAFRNPWGSLRYASNMAFMALLAAEDGIRTNEYRTWAKGQIGFALGDTGRSFVVGFGVNPPTQPYHRASSCPMMPARCSMADKDLNAPNPHILYGALVGGPDGNDRYTDRRTNVMNNGVKCDYNAGFQGAVAGLKSLHLRHILD